MSGPVVYRDFEDFAAQHGANRQDIGDVSLHRSSEHVSRAAFQRDRKRQANLDAQLLERRNELRTKYRDLIADGHAREMNRREKLEAASAGHPDLPSTQAAQRLLDRATTPAPVRGD